MKAPVDKINSVHRWLISRTGRRRGGGRGQHMNSNIRHQSTPRAIPWLAGKSTNNAGRKNNFHLGLQAGNIRDTGYRTLPVQGRRVTTAFCWMNLHLFTERTTYSSYNDNKYSAHNNYFFRTATTIASSPPLLRSTRNWEAACPTLVSPPPRPPAGAAVGAHVLWTWAKDITRANMRAFSSTPPGIVGDSGVSLLGPGGGYLRLFIEVETKTWWGAVR